MLMMHVAVDVSQDITTNKSIGEALVYEENFFRSLEL
jgi:hypothetical protein